MDPDLAGWRAVATLYHRFFTGLLLIVVTRRSAADAGEFAFRLFRAQHHDKFLAGVDKLGLSGEPDAVKAAGYHYLANRIGGVKVEFMREHDRKAWVHFSPPRWIYDGAAICGIPTEVSRGVLRGWYAQNGVSLGNPRLGFVCTGQTTDGQPGLTGYFLEYDRDLAPEERLCFSPGEIAPRFNPDAAPKLDTALWTPGRLAKAHRTYAMDYIRTGLPVLAQLFGPEEAGRLGRAAGRLIGMQFHDDVVALLGGIAPGATGFAALMARLAAAQDDDCAVEGACVSQTTWRLMRAVPAVPASVFEAWNGLLEGLLAVHDRFLRLEVRGRMDRGDPAFVWDILPGAAGM
ncbi:MAG: hypothetical protein NT133_07800 [Alphaproteobacteria bacterium]|nr:hypothetical protein [Alphaproteobacteria bacterium]